MTRKPLVAVSRRCMNSRNKSEPLTRLQKRNENPRNSELNNVIESQKFFDEYRSKNIKLLCLFVMPEELSTNDVRISMCST